MITIDLTSIKYVEGNTDLATLIKNKIKQFVMDFYLEYGVIGFDEAYTILNSGAFTILDQSILELIKNSKDANATEIKIEFSECFDGKVSFVVTDNGDGFNVDSKLGIYPISKDDLDESTKTVDKTKMGGKNTGCLQASWALHQNGGNLIRENIYNGEKVSGARLILTSNKAICGKNIEDYQEIYCSPNSSLTSKDSSVDINKMLSSITLKRAKMTASAKSRQGESSPESVVTVSLGANSSPDAVAYGAAITSSTITTSSDSLSSAKIKK